MSRELDFINETFHMLAQPVTALRATVELGLNTELQPEAHRILGDCLGLMDRLMQDIAVFREIASLGEAPPLAPRAGHVLFQSCTEEMEIVANASGITLALISEPLTIQCNEPSLRRAMFVLLDGMIASLPSGSTITVSLQKRRDGADLEVFPGMPPGQRQKLCLKLLQFSGGSGVSFSPDNTTVKFRESSFRQYQAITVNNKQFLTSQTSGL